MKSLVLISTGQPSTNPRLVKEAISLSNAGYNVTVLYSYWVAWAVKTDTEIIQSNSKITWIEVGGSPYSKIPIFILAKSIQKVSNFLSKLFKRSLFLQTSSSFRNYFFILKKAKSTKADLYIAHNLGALPVAAKAARCNKSKYGFDFEDYHLGQVKENFWYQYQTKLIEDTFIRNVTYTTAASPLIANEYKNRYSFLEPLVINNVFSKKHALKKINEFSSGDVLKIFWFSQTVGTNRGLEQLIESLGILKAYKIQVGFLGSCSNEIKLKLTSLATDNGLKQEQLIFHEPVDLNELFVRASEYHIGMALEVEQTINRQICLTNKIFVYLLSALAIVATETPAQAKFLTDFSNIGNTYKIGDVKALSLIIEKYIKFPELLNEHRRNALNLSNEKLNWEIEETFFLQLIKQVLSN